MNFSISNVSLSGVEDLIRTKAFDSAQGNSHALFSIFFALFSLFYVLLPREGWEQATEVARTARQH